MIGWSGTRLVLALSSAAVLTGCMNVQAQEDDRSRLTSFSYCPPGSDCPIEDPGGAWEGFFVSEIGNNEPGLPLLGGKAKLCPGGKGCPTGYAGYFKGRLFPAHKDLVICRPGSTPKPCKSDLGGRVGFLCRKDNAGCLQAIRRVKTDMDEG